MRLPEVLLEIAWSSQTGESFRRDALSEIDRRIGFDVALFSGNRPGTSADTELGFDRRFVQHYAQNEARLQPGMAILIGIARQHRGVAQDLDHLPRRRRDNLAYFTELAAPLGIDPCVFCELTVGGKMIGMLNAGRTSAHPFQPRELEALRQCLAALSLGHARFATPNDLAVRPLGDGARRAAWRERVSPREAEILELVILGFTNGEIAKVLGTSRLTVRNQVGSLLHKAGASCRTELVGIALRESGST